MPLSDEFSMMEGSREERMNAAASEPKGAIVIKPEIASGTCEAHAWTAKMVYY